MNIAGSLRKMVTRVRPFAWFGKGYVSYLLTGRHDRLSFLSMRELFCAANGRLNDLLALYHRALHRPYALNTRESVIGGLNRARLGTIVDALDRDGYYVFADRLPDVLCEELMELALRTPCSVVGFDNVTRAEAMRFEPGRVAGVRYDAEIREIVGNQAAQRVIGDLGLLAIAQSYFRAKAVQDLVAMWWSAPGPAASAAAAQMYHFDMARLKFLKFFFYLTDVDEHNGPHCFIAGSHRWLPRSLRRDKRHTDEEVFSHYPPEKRIEIKGRRGTICAVDTRGLHKGKQLVHGNRLMFQIEFAINLFGAEYSSIPLNGEASACLLEKISQYPYSFANYRNGR